MRHFTAHAVIGSWLFHDWLEAHELWNRMRALPGMRAMVIMPDHIHAMLRALERERWLELLRGYARWRNHRRGERGEVWLPAEAPEILKGWKHVRRSVRYIHLNPCRDHLVGDPLAWPFSTHRDAVGLTLSPVVAQERDAADFHSYISGDPSVRVDGTDLPYGQRSMRAPSSEQVIQAVSAATRLPLPLLWQRGPGRSLLVKSLKILCECNAREIARQTGVSLTTVWKTGVELDGQVALVERLLCDHRFAALHTHDLRHSASWRAYHRGRERRGAYLMLERTARQRRRRERAWREFEAKR